MNWNIIERNWKLYKGAVKQQWGKLTDDDLELIAGNRAQLIEYVQGAYALSADEAQHQIDAFEDRSRTNTWPDPVIDNHVVRNMHVAIPSHDL